MYKRQSLLNDFRKEKKESYRFKKETFKSLTELTPAQYKGFLSWITQTYFPQENNMRRKIIALFKKMGYEENGKADMRAINQWCSNYGKYNKKLNAHNYQELVALVSQVQIVTNKHIQNLCQ